MSLWYFFTLLDSDEYQTLGLFMFPHQDHVWFIGCVFYTPCPSCAFLMHCLCIAHSHLLLTPLLPLPCLGLYLVSTFLSCHVYLMLYSIVFLRCFFFCLSFIFSFILYPLCILSLFISSFLSLHDALPISHQDCVWFIDCLFYTPCSTYAFLMPCSCITHNHLQIGRAHV